MNKHQPLELSFTGKPSKDRSGPPKAFENPDNIAAANPQSPRLPLCLLEYGVGRLDAARCGFQFALAQPGEFPQPTKQLTVSRFAPPQQARLYVIEIPDERATGNNHNTMRKKARLLPFHLLRKDRCVSQQSKYFLTGEYQAHLLVPSYLAINSVDRIRARQHAEFSLGRVAHRIHSRSDLRLRTPAFDLVPLVATFASSRFAYTVSPLSDFPNPKTSHGNYVTATTSPKSHR
ncbi:hypothetical protein CPAR01_08629 [Colletotrichum paranaense]|uniref:Uncharacterized protein n=1 Tax=Colletotrichum paranaense TaxID=1914294 RepID=A0ABQ9SKU2_9PEZI|nr:uncharacterized protein CPAR01_08629 [Colletotrichum paranaense]KAK1538516.1 hypothetical protein CPAR01_08629 [Colletotrichum paranaense]